MIAVACLTAGLLVTTAALGAQAPRFLTLPFSGNHALLQGWTYNFQAQAHQGIDYSMRVGTPVLAAADGDAEWRYQGKDPNSDFFYGNYVVINHRNGYYSVYAHLETVGSPRLTIPKVGKTVPVKRGEVIGTSGFMSAKYPEPHLHFDTSLNGLFRGYRVDAYDIYSTVTKYPPNGACGPNRLWITDPPTGPTVPAPQPTTPAAPKVGPATAMVIDVSGSMDEAFQGARKIDKAKEAAKLLVQFVKDNSALNRADGKLSVTAFSSGARRQQNMTMDYAKVLSAIDKLQPEDSTNLAAGIEDAFYALQYAKTTYPKTMIILSDGLANEGMSDPDDIIAGPVTMAENKGMKIFTIGFGDSGSIDESLLDRIATATGGRYALADATKFRTDLSNLFISAQVSSTAKVIAQYQGTVAQGKTVAMGTFSVPQGAGYLQAVLNWPGSKLRLNLTDPSGTLVKAGYPGYRTSGTRPVQVKITNAKPGEWKASVYGQQVSQPKEPYYSLVAVQRPPSPSTSPTPASTPTSTPTVAPTPTPSPSASAAAKPTKKPSPKPKRTTQASASAAALPSGGGGGGGMGGGGALLFLVLLAGAGLIVWLVVRSRPGAGPAAGALVLVGMDGREYSLHAGPNSVGRDYGNDVLLDDSSVSRRHAVVEVSPAGVDLRDAGSTYGTKVNGLRVSSGRVSVGDELAFGAERLWLREARSGWIQ